MKSFSFFFLLLKTSIKASISKKSVFLTELTLMIFNNLLFFFMWWIFFRKFNTVADWEFQDMTILIIIGLGSFGILQTFFGGVKFLSKMIRSGELDSFLIQPKNILLHIASSKSQSKGWGHFISAIILIFLYKLFCYKMLLLILTGIITGGIVLTCTNVIAHSLPFWLGSVEGLSKKYCDSLYLFSLYPTHIYSGLLQILLFTALPAGLISYLPVDLIRSFSWIKLYTLLASACFFIFVAFFIFYKGLKKYESGNQFSLRS